MSSKPFPPPSSPKSDGSTIARRRLIAVGVIVGFVALVGLVILFSGSSEETAGPPPEVRTAAEENTGSESGVQVVDGTLTVVETRRLVLEPFEEGKGEMEFVITEEDAANFDIAHMQSHSSVALPTRLYYERDGDRLLAKYKEDAPVNSQQQDGS
jgi:hypothetical protein